MANIFLDLPIPPGNGAGAAVDTSGMGNPKTIEITGAFRGAIVIETSLDGGTTWLPVRVHTPNDDAKKVTGFAGALVRARRENVPLIDPGSPKGSISANDFGAMFAALPSGVSVDISAFGSDKTITVDNLSVKGFVNIEVSEDEINWASCVSFTNSGIKYRTFTAKFIRATGPAIVNIGAINEQSGGAMVDEKVKASASDTTTDYLLEKLEAGSGVSLSLENVGGDERVKITADGSTGSDELVKVSGDDNSSGYLEDKLVEGLGVDLTVLAPGGDEDIQIAVDVDEVQDNLSFAAPDDLAAGQANAEGVSTDVVRADHTHGVPTAVPVSTGPANVEGVATTFSRSDHVHKVNQGALEFAAPITVRGPTNAEGAGDEIARALHDHRLEYEVADEGILVSARPRTDYVGDGVGAVDVPGEDLTRVTIPGPNLGDGGAVVKRSTYNGVSIQTSSLIYQNALVDTTVPIDGAYWVMYEGEGENQSNGIQVEIAISVNNAGPGGAVVADSERISEGNASDMRPLVTTVQIPGLTAGDIIRCFFRRIGGGGPQFVALHRRHLTIIKVQ